MLVLYITLFNGQAGQCGRGPAEQFVEVGGEGAEYVVPADVQADQGLTVQAVGEVRHVHAAQRAVGQVQALQRSVEWTGWRDER